MIISNITIWIRIDKPNVLPPKNEHAKIVVIIANIIKQNILILLLFNVNKYNTIPATYSNKYNIKRSAPTKSLLIIAYT